MLVLSRNKNESIMIGDDVEITIVDVRGKVRLGITAPKSIKVHRREIYELIQKEKEEALKDLVMCNKAGICKEKQCGAQNVHSKSVCEPCPFDGSAKCVEVG